MCCDVSPGCLVLIWILNEFIFPTDVSQSIAMQVSADSPDCPRHVWLSWQEVWYQIVIQLRRFVDTLKYQYVPKAQAKTLWWRRERNVFPTRLQKFQLVNVQALALTIRSCSRKYFIRHENNCVTFIIIVQLGWWWKHSSIKITASQGILGKNLSGMRVVFIFWNIIL